MLPYSTVLVPVPHGRDIAHIFSMTFCTIKILFYALIYGNILLHGSYHNTQDDKYYYIFIIKERHVMAIPFLNSEHSIISFKGTFGTDYTILTFFMFLFLCMDILQ